MTILPPSAEDLLSHLRAQVDELGRDLAGAGAAAEEGVLLKQRIFLLHRAVEQHAQVIESLQSDVRMLVDGWKDRFAAGSSTPTSTGTVSAPDVADEVTIGRDTIPPASNDTVHGDPVTVTPAVTTTTTKTATTTTTAELPAVVPVSPARRPASGTPVDARLGIAAPVAGQPRVIDELNASTFVERGWSRIATGDYVGAEAALDKALALNPGDVNAETLLGWAQMGQGKLDTAMEIFQRVLERIPDHALALINVGFVHLRRGNLDLAIENLTTAIAFDSDRKAMLYAHYYLGLVHFEREQYPEAIGALLRAIELGPNMIEARFELGRVFWFAERTDDAIATWRKGAELNKFNPWSARCRDLLTIIADGGAPSRVV